MIENPVPSPRRHLAGAALAALLAAGALLPAAAQAQEAAQGMGDMHGMGAMHGDMHAGMMAHIERALTAAGASAEQKQRIAAIMMRAHEPMSAMHEGMERTHAELIRLLAAPQIDRAAIEEVRARQMAQMDEASRRMVDALIDAAQVLTPEQRARLGAMMAETHPPAP